MEPLTTEDLASPGREHSYADLLNTGKGKRSRKSRGGKKGNKNANKQKEEQYSPSSKHTRGEQETGAWMLHCFYCVIPAGDTGHCPVIGTESPLGISHIKPEFTSETYTPQSGSPRANTRQRHLCRPAIQRQMQYSGIWTLRNLSCAFCIGFSQFCSKFFDCRQRICRKSSTCLRITWGAQTNYRACIR